MKIDRKNRGSALLEALASGAILTIILTLTFKSYHSRMEAIGTLNIQTVAASVAERQMEKLLAALQEPEETGIYQPDDIEEDFNWKLDLERIMVDDNINSKKEATYANTIIKATVSVLHNKSDSTAEPLERIRYLSALRGNNGNAVGVPLEEKQNEDQISDTKKDVDKDKEIEEPKEKEKSQKEQELLAEIEKIKAMLADTATDKKLIPVLEGLLRMLEDQLAALRGGN
jgi:hypothetical protein